MTEQVETLTILFADISGSTRIIKEHGDLSARLIIERCLARVARAVTGHGGRVMGQIGDELMCAFGDVHQALAATLDIQDAVRAGGLAGEYPPAIRMHIGLHQGPVVVDRDQIFGDTIHVAKRLVDLAKADQILTTQATLDAASAIPSTQFRLVDRVRIKGYDEAVAIHELMRLDPEMTMVFRTLSTTQTAEHYLRCRLAQGDRIHILDEARPIFSIGREEGHDLPIHQGCVSRDHGRLEYQKGRIIYIDHSTNGTFITEENAPELVQVHREQRWLRGRGLLRFGSREDPSGELSLEYRCELEP